MKKKIENVCFQNRAKKCIVVFRFLPSEYDDGVQSIRRSKNGRPLPSAREITNLIHENKDVPLASVTHMLMQWGQFVDHDLTGAILKIPLILF